MSKYYKEQMYWWQKRAAEAGFTFSEMETVRRAAMTLHRWSEHECNGYIERDEETGKCYGYNPNHTYLAANDPRARWRVADRETPALNRVKAIAEKHGCDVEYNGDPRGWPLTFRKIMPDTSTLEFSPPIRG